MKLKQKTTKELQEIIKRDYCQEINESEAQELGTSLLRLTRIALTAQARSIEKSEKK